MDLKKEFLKLASTKEIYRAIEESYRAQITQGKKPWLIFVVKNEGEEYLARSIAKRIAIDYKKLEKAGIGDYKALTKSKVGFIRNKSTLPT